MSTNEALLCPLGFFAAASATTISIRSADRTVRRQVRASASLEAICLAAIDDWQFVKISRGLAQMCADMLSHVHGWSRNLWFM
jgi:hypothetical protein